MTRPDGILSGHRTLAPIGAERHGRATPRRRADAITPNVAFPGLMSGSEGRRRRLVACAHLQQV